VPETPLQVTHSQSNDAGTPSVMEVLTDAAKRTVLQVQDYAKLSYHSVLNLFTPPRYGQDTVQRFGQVSLTGDIVCLALVRELGPSITGLLVAGRCSSGIASELGSMLVTEQVDAMRAMGTDPGRKLVSPRVLASLVVVPLLTTISVFIGLVGGMVASVFSLRLSATTFWQRAIAILEFSDLMQGFTKSVVFGFILSTVGCYQGLNVRGGTQGVGRATTQAVVVSSVLIIVADTFLTRLALFLADKL